MKPFLVPLSTMIIFFVFVCGGAIDSMSSSSSSFGSSSARYVGAFQVYSPVQSRTDIEMMTTLRRKMHLTTTKITTTTTKTTTTAMNMMTTIPPMSSSLPYTFFALTKRGKNSKRNNNNRLSSSVEGDFNPDVISQNVEDVKSGSLKARLRSIYKFVRPHTIRGTILASIAGTIRALVDTPGAIANAKWGIMLPRAIIGMIALLLGNAYIVGINQIYDVGIDKMNKPFLPIASGEMSKTFAWAMVLSCGILGPLIVYNFFPPLLFRLYMLGWTLGGVYSVPPIRTKRNALLAALTIATVRGFLLNFGVYYAVINAIGGGNGMAAATFTWSPKVSFIARFMTVYATVIAITKDLPDTEGDMAYKIDTFATRVGVSKIAKGASLCLLLNYVHAILTGVFQKNAFNPIFMIGGHGILSLLLMYRFLQLDSSSIPSIKKYYKHIWDLFYLEYVLYTLI